MNIINNLTQNNHFERVTELLRNCDEITIASPYLMPDFTNFLANNSIKKNAKINLITTLQENSIEQISKIKSLVSFANHPNLIANNVNLTISINNKLHGKLYIFRQDDFNCCIISSANFTNNGLITNHEWGIEISDRSLISNIAADLINTLDIKNISQIDLNNLHNAVNNFTTKNKIPVSNIELNLMKLLPKISNVINIQEINCWLKPIGDATAPVSEERLFNDLELNLHFSKGRPNSVKIDDLLICYGVGVTQILSVYRVASAPLKVASEEIQKNSRLGRWPWYVIGENITPNFGNKWWEYKINPFQMVEEYKSQGSSDTITKVGGKSLGAINQGKDKVNLNSEFAIFLLQQIISINDKIASR